MEARWYYAEKGASGGPATSGEIVKRIEQCEDQLQLIWTEGISACTAASVIHAAASTIQKVSANIHATKGRAALVSRARNELMEYLAIAAYLTVCFGALLFYKATILGSEGIEYFRFGLAVVKALILGKFVLVLEGLKIGSRWKSAGIFVDIPKKAFLFTLLLIPLTIIEELIAGYSHGEGAREVLKDFAGGTLPQAVATAVLLFLILIPYFAYREITAKLDEAGISRLIFERKPSSQK